jgi:hypothetical protein
MKDKIKKSILSDKKIRAQVQKLVIARLSAIPRDLEIAVGDKQYSIEDLQKFVEENNKVGIQLMEDQLKYLRNISSGEIYKMWPNEQNNTYNQAQL